MRLGAKAYWFTRVRFLMEKPGLINFDYVEWGIHFHTMHS